MEQKNWQKFIPACISGNILELYEFIIYGYFASILGSLFFPTGNKYTALIAAFAVFATGSLIRPFSALFFGYMGDKVGRKASLIYSIGIMAFATLSIGLLPTYAQVGILAPLLLIFCRIAQSLSMTSEEVGAALFLMENAPLSQKGFAGSLILGSVYIGLLTGALVATLIFALIPPDSLQSWGWRIPFLLGGIIGLITLLLRINQPESPEFTHAAKIKQLSKNPLLTLFKENFFQVIRITFLFSSLAVGVYLFAVFIPNTLDIEALNTTKQIIMLICSLMFFVTFTVSILFGKLSDIYGGNLLLGWSFGAWMIFSYPIFLLLSAPSLILVIMGYLFFAFLMGVNVGPLMLMAMQAFPVNIRFSGSCLAFNFSMSFFGGTAPLLAMYLIKTTSLPASPAFLMMAASMLGFVALVRNLKSVEEQNNEHQTCRENG